MASKEQREWLKHGRQLFWIVLVCAGACAYSTSLSQMDDPPSPSEFRGLICSGDQGFIIHNLMGIDQNDVNHW